MKGLKCNVNIKFNKEYVRSQRLLKYICDVYIFTIQINQPTKCNNFSSLLLDVCIQLNMLLPDQDQQYCYHQAPTVKPDAATAVVELLMMGVRTPEAY